MHLTTVLGVAALSSLVTAVPLAGKLSARQDEEAGPYASVNTPAGPAPGVDSEEPFALDNGFPNITNPSEELTAINENARGTLSNAPPPANSPSNATLTSLRLIAFNEIFETFYFTELLNNVTEGVEGYTFEDEELRISRVL